MTFFDVEAQVAGLGRLGSQRTVQRVLTEMS